MHAKFATLILGAVSVLGQTTQEDDNLACGVLFAPAANDTLGPDGNPFNPFHKSTTVALTICRNAWNATVDETLRDLSKSGAPPKAATYPEFSTNIFAQHSRDGKVWNVIDWETFYYGVLVNRTRRFPPKLDSVTQAWANVAAWTGFCDGNIPYENMNDWFHFQSTVPGALSSCDSDFREDTRG